LLFEFHSSHSFAISPHITPHFRIIFAKIRQVSTSFKTSFALCCSYCVVVEFHSSHRFAISPTG
jgi:hypothetical protein